MQNFDAANQLLMFRLDDLYATSSPHTDSLLSTSDLAQIPMYRPPYTTFATFYIYLRSCQKYNNIVFLGF